MAKLLRNRGKEVVANVEESNVTTSSEVDTAREDDEQPTTSIGSSSFRLIAQRSMILHVAPLILSTAIRMMLFSHFLFGNLLLRELAPVERESVHYSIILMQRSVDWIVLLWTVRQYHAHNPLQSALQSVSFGAILTSVSRLSLYAFEHAYFLLSAKVVLVLLLIDLVSLSAPFALLPHLLPTPMDVIVLVSRDEVEVVALPVRGDSWLRRLRNLEKEFWLDIVLAVTLSTVLGSLFSYVVERMGGLALFKSMVYAIKVPSFLSADTLTTSQMMAHPTIPIPVLRSFLLPASLESHMLSSFALSLLTAPLALLHPVATFAQLADIVFLLIFPATTLGLWNVFPVQLLGALGSGLVLGVRGMIIIGTSAWTLEELRKRERRRVLGIIPVAVPIAASS